MAKRGQKDVGWIVVEDDDGVAVVGEAFNPENGQEVDDAILLAEMEQNSDLALDEGTARTWVLTVYADGRRPTLGGISGRAAYVLRKRYLDEVPPSPDKES